MEPLHEAVGLRLETGCSGTYNVQEGAQNFPEDVNCAPPSKVIFAGTPNLEIQPEMRALAQSTTEMEARELEKTSILSR